MTRKSVVLVTGAGGEMGHGLITRLAELGTFDILALDVQPLDPDVSRHCTATRIGDILDRHLLDRLRSEFEISAVFHLAALLSTRAEFVPETAHEVNVEGTLGLLRLAVDEARSHGRPVKFLFPSSIAVYGLPDLATKRKAGRVGEHDWLMPVTMYGCNKLYCEHLGRYFARHYRQLAPQAEPSGVDFRAIRFPGLISAVTAAERRHERLRAGDDPRRRPGPALRLLRARGHAHPVHGDARRDRRAPRPAGRPGGVADGSRLQRGGVQPERGELAELVRRAFPGARIAFAPDARRQAILDSWPEDVDDTRARRDWSFRPAYDLDRTFNEYLVPNVARRYAQRLAAGRAPRGRGRRPDVWRRETAASGGARRRSARRGSGRTSASSRVRRAPG